jgi:heptosyltransferase III
MKKIELNGNEKILLIRTDRVGDLVLSTPVAEAIKRVYPRSFITFLASPYTQEILKSNPFVDEVISDNCRGIKGFFPLLKMIRSKKFDVAIFLFPRWRLSFSIFLAGIKIRIGTAYRAYSPFFNYKIRKHRKTIEKHELEYNLDMLSALNIYSEKIAPKIFLSPEEGKAYQRFFRGLNLNENEKVVIVHPGSKNSTLSYPLEKLAGVADKIIEKTGARMIITGGKDEINLARQMKNQMRNKPGDLTGETNIRELAAIIKKAHLFISNSTGPMHIASALETPVIAFFSPIFVAGPKRWGPYGVRNVVFLPPVGVCLKCQPKKCPHYDCMEKIDEDLVVSRAIEILQGN